jgi:hypothetical protein
LPSPQITAEEMEKEELDIGRRENYHKHLFVNQKKKKKLTCKVGWLQLARKC